MTLKVITTGTEALDITSDGVLVKKGNAVEEIPADTVVLGISALPYNPLEKHLKQIGRSPEEEELYVTFGNYHVPVS